MTANSGASLKNFALISQWCFPQPSWVNYSNQLWVLRSLGTHWELTGSVTPPDRLPSFIVTIPELILTSFSAFFAAHGLKCLARSSPFLDRKAAILKRLFERVSDLSCLPLVPGQSFSLPLHIFLPHLDKILLLENIEVKRKTKMPTPLKLSTHFSANW